MSNKFNILGCILKLDDETLHLKVRRNFRDYENQFVYDEIKVFKTTGLSLSTLSSLDISDIISVHGRVENDHLNNTILLAEHIVSIKELEEKTEDN